MAAPEAPNSAAKISVVDGVRQVVVPIVFGSMSFWLGKKAEESKTHKWHVYVRGINNEDLSPLIKNVTFSLHPSFKTYNRVIEEAPFMVTEMGWGEFEIPIKIALHEPAGAVVELQHKLGLFSTINEPLTQKKPVVSEYYDELIFYDPPESVMERIRQCVQIIPTFTTVAGTLFDSHFTVFSEEAEIMKMQTAIRRIQAETELLVEKFQFAESECGMLREDVARMEKQLSGPLLF